MLQPPPAPCAPSLPPAAVPEVDLLTLLVEGSELGPWQTLEEEHKAKHSGRQAKPGNKWALVQNAIQQAFENVKVGGRAGVQNSKTLKP